MWGARFAETEHIPSENVQRAKTHNKKRGNSLSMEKHMDILQACVMVPLPTPTWPMTSARFLSPEAKAKTERECKLWSQKVFYPESSIFPWSLRSAAQSSDRQFFSNQVWWGNSKVHRSYDLMLAAHRTHTDCTFGLGGSVVLLLELRVTIFAPSDLSFNQSEHGPWFKLWKGT